MQNLLDYLRLALYAALLVVGFFLFQAWQHDHAKQQPVAEKTAALPENRYVPEATTSAPSAQSAAVAATQTVPAEKTGKLVSVVTDTLEVKIDTLGGDIVEVNLRKYPESLGSKTPFTFLNDAAKTRYIAQSGLLSQQGPDTSKAQAQYQVEQSQYQLADGQNQLLVKLHWQSPEGLKVTKVFSFKRDSYEIGVTYDVSNQSSHAWKGNLYTQLLRSDTPPETSSGLVGLATYFGAAVSSSDKPFEKISFKEIKEKPLNRTVEGGWAAMIQHYFVGAWIPAKGMTSTYYTKAMNNGLFTVGMIGESLNVAPGANITTSASLYAGPAIADRLEAAAPNLNLTIDYGWFWIISVAIFWMMQHIFDIVGNWGWAIVLVTVVIKLLFYQLSAKSYRSMSKLKKLQPKMEALKERYGEDRQQLTQETLKLYREEKVNPMSGCLPILIQIPVFIALYWVLVESVQLRQAPFILWIHDLSHPDPYYVLPILMGISMFLQQRLNPPPPDPMQAKVMMAMPIIFTFLFANFPAGLMLYWFVNNSLSFLQQWFIMHRLEKETNDKR